MPSLRTAADDARKSAQDSQFYVVQPTFSVSHGDTGGGCVDFSTNYDPIFATFLPTKPSVLASTASTVKPTSSMLYPYLLAKAANFQSDKFPNFDDMVRFFQ